MQGLNLASWKNFTNITSANIFATYVSENVSYWPVSAMLQACASLLSSESVLIALCEASKEVASPSGEPGLVPKRSKLIPTWLEEDHTHTGKYAAEHGSTKAVLHFSTLLK